LITCVFYDGTLQKNLSFGYLANIQRTSLFNLFQSLFVPSYTVLHDTLSLQKIELTVKKTLPKHRTKRPSDVVRNCFYETASEFWKE